MDKDTIIKQLKDANDQFKRETELLKGRIKELVANWLCMRTHILHQV
uniref:Uncharacterized protein n=1 Tax=Candidatus Methanogaster sp. ANME-2c ERB4 TaxID=2759911 RepID=A0A7G9YF33_9EURY|nr:hypothetical protein OEAKOMNL_00018 [Methanosarcinales archaeon ANME-2c ERB4]